MQHLSCETLARLVEEAPGHLEAVHLEGCATCQCELEALRAQTHALADLPDLQPPAEQWRFLEARLRGEGLIRREPAARPWWNRTPLRVAASIALFLLGGVTGAALTRGDGGETQNPALLTGREVHSAEDAARLLREREIAYLAALERYAELTGDSRPADPVAQLAALEGIMLTTRAALEAAPADPVINGYHLMALGQREAVLRQIARTTVDPWF
ncbi:MAG: hypothetical protein H0W11_07855 [Gemmatimonadetes bacterium]|nr:hypothetical protein [Gemmatimonadota bacterium]